MVRGIRHEFVANRKQLCVCETKKSPPKIVGIFLNHEFKNPRLRYNFYGRGRHRIDVHSNEAMAGARPWAARTRYLPVRTPVMMNIPAALVRVLCRIAEA